MGPSREEIKVVSQGDELNQDWNKPCAASRSFFRFANPSLTLAIESLTTPE